VIGPFSSRTPDESFPLGFDFAAVLGVGETITSATITASLIEGTDADVATRFTGAVAIAGTTVRRRFVAGADGARYLITAVAVTSASNTFEECAELLVEACQ
jgi:hypothetical protein